MPRPPRLLITGPAESYGAVGPSTTLVLVNTPFGRRHLSLYRRFRHIVRIFKSHTLDTLTILEMLLELLETPWLSRNREKQIGITIASICAINSGVNLYQMLKEIRRNPSTINTMRTFFLIIATLSFIGSIITKSIILADPQEESTSTPEPLHTTLTPYPTLELDTKPRWEFLSTATFASGALFTSLADLMETYVQPEGSFKEIALNELRRVSNLLEAKIAQDVNLPLAAFGPNGISIIIMANWVVQHHTPRIEAKKIGQACLGIFSSSAFLYLMTTTNDFYKEQDFTSYLLRFGIGIFPFVYLIIVSLIDFAQYFYSQIAPVWRYLKALKTKLQFIQSSGEIDRIYGSAAEVQRAISLIETVGNLHYSQRFVSSGDLMKITIVQKFVENIFDIEREYDSIRRNYSGLNITGPRQSEAHSAFPAAISHYTAQTHTLPALSQTWEKADKDLAKAQALVTQREQELENQNAEFEASIALCERENANLLAARTRLSSASGEEMQRARQEVLDFERARAEVDRRKANLMTLTQNTSQRLAEAERHLAHVRTQMQKIERDAGNALETPATGSVSDVLDVFGEIYQVNQNTISIRVLTYIYIVMMNDNEKKIIRGFHRLKEILRIIRDPEYISGAMTTPLIEDSSDVSSTTSVRSIRLDTPEREERGRGAGAGAGASAEAGAATSGTSSALGQPILWDARTLELLIPFIRNFL